MQRFRESVHEAPIVDEDGYSYLVHPLTNGVPMVEPAILREVVVAVTRHVDLDVDKVVAPAAMGIHLATAVSLQTDVPLVVIRDRQYGLEGELVLEQDEGYAPGTRYINDVSAGDRVLVLDDVFASGGTLAAICGGLDEIGAEVADVVTLIRRRDVDPVDFDREVTSLVDVSIEDGAVVVHE